MCIQKGENLPIHRTSTTTIIIIIVVIIYLFIPHTNLTEAKNHYNKFLINMYDLHNNKCKMSFRNGFLLLNWIVIHKWGWYNTRKQHKPQNLSELCKTPPSYYIWVFCLSPSLKRLRQLSAIDNCHDQRIFCCCKLKDDPIICFLITKYHFRCFFLPIWLSWGTYFWSLLWLLLACITFLNR